MDNPAITVLAIDDSPDILYAITAICDLEGWKTVTSTDGRLACGLIQTHRPQIVLVDYHMSALNGIDVVKYIRMIDTQTPIIVLTIEDNREIAEKFFAAGADDFAIKPIRPLDLISRIRVHLSKNTQPSPAPAPKAQDDYVKGISNKTIKIVTDYLERQDDYRAIEEISEGCGLAYQTTYRYLTHLVSRDLAEYNIEYGKQGRPKQKYRLKR
ncbi:MAG: response regulator [Christensenellaceae bacterium]|jgi:two-component system response regulator DctR|nr:response regulator [Christensenellaceae bacterium]